MEEHNFLNQSKRYFPSHFLLTEVLIAFEQMGLLQYIERKGNFSVKEAAASFGLKEFLLAAACEFLAEKNMLKKIAGDSFRTNLDFKSLRRPVRFLTAYKDIFSSVGDLMSGKKVYGRDITRDATYLGAGTALSIPLLVQWFEELGVKSVLDIGCGRGDLLLALASAIPGFQGVGVEVDEPMAKLAEEAVSASPHRDSIRIVRGDARFPERLAEEASAVEAVVGIAVFHEFDSDGGLVPVLKRYRASFPASRLLVVEFDTPDWDALREESQTPAREQAAMYLLAHYFTNQGLPRGKKEWISVLEEAGWTVNEVKDLRIRLTAFACR